MAVTENFGWPLPDETATVREEMERLRDQTLPSIDADVRALEVEVFGKATDDHVHAIGDVTGLQTALDGKLPANTTFAVGDLTDVVGADAAPDGYVLVKVGEQWVAQAAAAAIGAHDHLISDVSGLEDILQLLAPLTTLNPEAPTQSPGDNSTRLATTAFVQAAIAALSDYWALQPVGVPIAVLDNIVGVSAPATNKSYRYVKLTASDAYNTGILTGESVSGSAPNITASAVVSLSTSPINGRTVPLINTERRFLRGGSAGTKEASQNLSHAHSLSIAANGQHQHYSAIGPAGGSDYGLSYRIDAGFYGGATANVMITSAAGSHGHTGSADANGGTEARPNNIGVTYYMRIK